MARFETAMSRRDVLRAGAKGASVLALGPLLAACSSGTTTAPTTSGGSPRRGGTLTLGRDQGPTQLDPANSIVGGDVYTLDKIFEPLYITDVNGALQPWLADSHTVSSDGKTWTFHLRPGVTFSDGKPLVADDVVFSIDRAARDQNGPLSFLDSAISKLSADGSSVVVAQLSEPWAPFLSDISVFANSILPKDFGGQSASAFFNNPVGTGPFILQSFTKGASATLKRNPHYWQTGKPYLDQISLGYVSDDNQRVLQLKSGQLDVISTVPASAVGQLRTDSSVTVGIFPAWSVDLLFFNEKVHQFADRHVRRAIAYAVDQQGIVAATTFHTSQAGGSFFPPSLEYYDPHTPVLSYSLSAAKHELAKSAYPSGFSTQLLIQSGNQQWAEIAQILQSSLKSLNIAVSIEQLDNAAYTTAFQAFKYDMMINNASNDISDPDEMASFQIDVHNGGSESFWTNYNNPTAIALVHQAQAEMNPAKRATLYAQIQAIVSADAPYVPLDYPPSIYAWADTVHGFAVNPGGAYRLEDVWLS